VRRRVLGIAGASIAVAAAAILTGQFAGDDPGFEQINFGEVHLGGLPRTVTTEITLENSRPEPIEITYVHSTCGCTTGKGIGERIPARGTLTVPIELTVKDAGQVVQQIEYVLSTGESRKFQLVAKGIVTGRLQAIIKDPSVASDARSIDVELLWLGSLTGSTPEIIVVEPSGARFALDHATMIEEEDKVNRRPTRFLLAGAVLLDAYEGDYPVKVHLQSEGGGECTFNVSLDSLATQ